MSETQHDKADHSNFWLEGLKYQIIDSALPTGAFAHSAGLEAATQLGLIEKFGRDLYIRALLENIASQDLPFVYEGLKCASTWNKERHSETTLTNWKVIDKAYGAVVFNPVARRASVSQGVGKPSKGVAAAGLSSSQEVQAFIKSMRQHVQKAKEHNGYLAPVFGIISSLLGISEIDSQYMYLFMASRDMVSAAIRLSLCGPIEAVSLQHQLGSECAKLVAMYGNRKITETSQTFPLSDIIQGCHDKLYRKMFNT